MSYGGVVHRSIEERKRRERQHCDRVERAKVIVAKHLPDLCAGGYVDGWAVRAVLALNAAGDRISEAAIRRARAASVVELDRGTTVADRERELPNTVRASTTTQEVAPS